LFIIKIFVNTEYFEQVLPKLLESTNMTLVIHHSDRFFDRIMFEAVRPCVSRILARNCDWSHPLVTQLPIGFVDAPPNPGQFMTKIRIDEALYKSIRESDVVKDVNMYVNVNLHGAETKFASVRALRQKCLEAFPGADTERRPLPDFLKMLRRSKYVACPMGFGIDTHRFFEAAYMKARPVVISSGLDPLYRKFGAIILDKWSDPLPEWSEPAVPEEMFHTGFWMTN
jgi:hypothetical protein